MGSCWCLGASHKCPPRRLTALPVTPEQVPGTGSARLLARPRGLAGGRRLQWTPDFGARCHQTRRLLKDSRFTVDWTAELTLNLTFPLYRLNCPAHTSPGAPREEANPDSGPALLSEAPLLPRKETLNLKVISFGETSSLRSSGRATASAGGTAGVACAALRGGGRSCASHGLPSCEPSEAGWPRPAPAHRCAGFSSRFLHLSW